MDETFYEVEYRMSPAHNWVHYGRFEKLSGVNGAQALAKAVSEGPMAQDYPTAEVRIAKIHRSVLSVLKSTASL